ncbi:MAG: hypothetical protein E7Z72_00615 [Methanocorpusculum parvum]|nr:hypothetical protein [Methanocorpusculum parvum]
MTPTPIHDLLRQTIAVQKATSTTDGDHEYSNPVQHPARIEHTTRRVLNTKGEEVVSTALIITVNPIGKNDRITLPDGTAKTPLQVSALPDADGAIGHYEVLI